MISCLSPLIIIILLIYKTDISIVNMKYRTFQSTFNPLAPDRCPNFLQNIFFFQMPILTNAFDYFPVKLVWEECQYSRVNIGTVYGLVPSSNKP